MIGKGRRIGRNTVAEAVRRLAFHRDRRAVTAIEYALIAGVMVVALVASVPAIGPELSNIFSAVSQHL